MVILAGKTVVVVVERVVDMVRLGVVVVVVVVVVVAETSLLGTSCLYNELK